MVIGDAAASSTLAFSGNRPSSATAYCARELNPELPVLPVVSRDGKSASGAPELSVQPSAVI